MGSEWVETTIGNLCQKVVTGGTPLKSNDAFYENADIPWLKTKEVNFCRIYETENFVSDLALRKSSVKLIPENSVIVAMYGQGDTAGRVAINKIPLTTNQACCNLIIDASKADYRFIYFYLKNSYQELVRRKTGSAQPNLNTNIIKSFEVKAPPLDLQIKIGEILGSLDDKIELNRQINTTLEAMAQALFKSWFVDFDPVIDNALAAGNPIPPELAARAKRRQQHHTRANTSADAQTTPYQPLPAAIQQQFPNHFVFTEAMGWVPEGWECASIYKLMDVIYGAPFQSSMFNSNGVGLPIIRIRDLKTGTPQNWSDEDHPKKTLIRTGDVVAGMDAEFRATLWSGNEGYLNQRLFFAKPKLKFVNELFIKFSLNPLLDFEERTQVGTTVAHLGKKEIDRFLMLVPSDEVLMSSDFIFSPLHSRLVENFKSLKSLTKLRDTLLPKLLSGQLRIPDAEAAVDKVLAEA